MHESQHDAAPAQKHRTATQKNRAHISKMETTTIISGFLTAVSLLVTGAGVGARLGAGDVVGTGDGLYVGVYVGCCVLGAGDGGDVVGAGDVGAGDGADVVGAGDAVGAVDIRGLTIPSGHSLYKNVSCATPHDVDAHWVPTNAFRRLTLSNHPCIPTHHKRSWSKAEAP